MSSILWPIEVAVAWIMVKIHTVLVSLGMSDGSGAAWVWSIVGLTVVIRILIMPLFFRQIKASRGMQLMQPELQALQKKYKGKTDPVSRQAQQQEMMDLYKKHNANPFSSCLPILLQMPIFFALFRVLNSLPTLASGEQYNGHEAIGPLTETLAEQILNSSFLGAPLSATFMTSVQQDGNWAVAAVAAVLVVTMGATQFISIKQLSMKNMPASAMDNPIMRQQQIMLYVMPIVFAVSGVAFPIGVLIYWTISNFWSMGQQAYTIRRQPAPGSEAYRAKQARDAAKRAKKGLPPLEDDVAKTEEIQPQGQRVQPMSKARAKKKGTDPLQPITEQSESEDAEETTDEAEDVPDAAADGEVRGKDGLTDAERARKRYEARQAQRAAARKKRAEAEKRRQQNQNKKGKYNN